jgi:hypothetical protein
MGKSQSPSDQSEIVSFLPVSCPFSQGLKVLARHSTSQQCSHNFLFYGMNRAGVWVREACALNLGKLAVKMGRGDAKFEERHSARGVRAAGEARGGNFCRAISNLVNLYPL